MASRSSQGQEQRGDPAIDHCSGVYIRFLIILSHISSAHVFSSAKPAHCSLSHAIGHTLFVPGAPRHTSVRHTLIVTSHLITIITSHSFRHSIPCHYLFAKLVSSQCILSWSIRHTLLATHYSLHTNRHSLLATHYSSHTTRHTLLAKHCLSHMLGNFMFIIFQKCRHFLLPDSWTKKSQAPTFSTN